MEKYGLKGGLPQLISFCPNAGKKGNPGVRNVSSKAGYTLCVH